MSCGIHFDLTLDQMEETRFRKKHTDLIKKLTKELHFNYRELESILLIYYKLKKRGQAHQPAMTRAQFLEVLHQGLDMTDTERCEDIVSILDKSPSQYFSMEAWARAMSLFLRGTFEEKIVYCFNVYNLMGDGKLTRDKMVHLLRHSTVGWEDAEDVVKELIEILTKKMDVDRDGKISFSDFKETVMSQPLMLEAFGQCLPSRLATHAFLTTFTRNVRKL